MTVPESAAPEGGALYRRIRLTPEPGCCTAALEDDFHHFVLSLHHEAGVITGVSVVAYRTPWSICHQALEKLQQLVGQALSTRPLATVAGIDAKQQCTHQYDLALLAVAQARRGVAREYKIRIPDARAGSTCAELLRNDQQVLNWPMQGTIILGDGGFSGQDVRHIMPTALATLDDDELEAVFALRRACMVTQGRSFDLDHLASADVPLRRMAGACYVFQPERVALALRVRGSTRHDIRGQQDLLRDREPQAPGGAVPAQP